MANLLCDWLMAAITLAFVLIYGAALVGWLQPLPNEQAVMRLEPIIFVVIGYYFGRLPARQHETTLKEEIARLAQKADATQHAKEQLQQEREALEEKVKGVRAALSAGAAARSSRDGGAERPAGDGAAHHSIATALHVLNA